MIRPGRGIWPLLLLLFALPVRAETTLRVATFNVELLRDGPGILLRDIRGGSDPQVQAVVEVLIATRPDILALQGIDYDHGLAALTALAEELDQTGLSYPHRFALPTNRGLHTGLDLDGDGRTGEAADAQGYGRFYGQGGMAVLSRFPIDRDRVQDFTELPWADLPGAQQPRRPDGALFPDPTTAAAQRLSSSGHWVVPIQMPDGQMVSLLTFHASPPVFDGPEDRNGLRNADEIRLWVAFLDEKLGQPIDNPFVIAGSATLDPNDSDGRHEAIRALLAHPRLRPTRPSSPGARQAGDQGHRGPNELDTVDWTGVGRLRVDYVLPSSDLQVGEQVVYWPAPGAEGANAADVASRHRLVYVDLRLP